MVPNIHVNCIKRLYTSGTVWVVCTFSYRAYFAMSTETCIKTRICGYVRSVVERSKDQLQSAIQSSAFSAPCGSCWMLALRLCYRIQWRNHPSAYHENRHTTNVSNNFLMERIRSQQIFITSRAHVNIKAVFWDEGSTHCIGKAFVKSNSQLS